MIGRIQPGVAGSRAGKGVSLIVKNRAGGFLARVFVQQKHISTMLNPKA
jgi:hypothetical protein